MNLTFCQDICADYNSSSEVDAPSQRQHCFAEFKSWLW